MYLGLDMDTNVLNTNVSQYHDGFMSKATPKLHLKLYSGKS